MSRLIERLVSAERATGRSRIIVLAAALVAIVVIALVNGAFDIALRAFYSVPVVVVTIAVSTGAGALYAVLAALAWTFDRAVTDPLPAVATSVNAVLRVAGFLVLVTIVSTLRSAIEAARESERRSREFLGFAAHQLRTPVAGVRASAEAFVLTDDPTTRDELLAGIAGEAGRMGRLISALLRIARLDQGDVLARTDVDPSAVVSAEIDRLRQRSPDLEVTLREHDIPHCVSLDAIALSEIVGNLLDNARRHADGRVDVELHHLGDALRIVIADDGPGLPSGQEARAFERFVSLDGRGGSGLGLAIARALAEAHGGHLTYEGGRFTVSVSAPSTPSLDG